MFNCKYYCCTAPLDTVSRNERSTSGINLNLPMAMGKLADQSMGSEACGGRD